MTIRQASGIRAKQHQWSGEERAFAAAEAAAEVAFGIAQIVGGGAAGPLGAPLAIKGGLDVARGATRLLGTLGDRESFDRIKHETEVVSFDGVKMLVVEGVRSAVTEEQFKLDHAVSNTQFLNAVTGAMSLGKTNKLLKARWAKAYDQYESGKNATAPLLSAGGPRKPARQKEQQPSSSYHDDESTAGRKPLDRERPIPDGTRTDDPGDIREKQRRQTRDGVSFPGFDDREYLA